MEKKEKEKQVKKEEDKTETSKSLSSELIELISSDSEDESTNVPSSSIVNRHLSPSPKGKPKSNHDTSSDDSPKKEVDLFSEDAPTLPPLDFEFTENDKEEDDDGMTQSYRLSKDEGKNKNNIQKMNDSFSEDAPTLAPSEFEYTEDDDSTSIKNSTSFSEDAPTLPPSDFELEEDDELTQAYRLRKDKDKKKKKNDSFSEDALTSLAPSEIEEDTKDEEMESNERVETQRYSLFKDMNEPDEAKKDKKEQEKEDKQKSESDDAESEEFSFKKPENSSNEKLSDEPSSPGIGRNPAPNSDPNDSVSASLSFTDMADQWSKRKQKITETKGLEMILFAHFNF